MYQSIVQHNDFKTYIFRRIIIAIIVFFLITIFIFFVTYKSPEPVMLLNPPWELGEEQSRTLIKELGLNKPSLVRYFEWLSGIFRGDFGVTYQDYSMN